MFTASTKMAGGTQVASTLTIRSTTTVQGVSVTIPVGTQVDDLLVLYERANADASAPSGFEMVVSANNGVRWASISWKQADALDPGRVIRGMDTSFGRKVLYVLYADKNGPVFSLGSGAVGEVTDATPTARVISTTSVTGAVAIFCGFGTNGTSATRTFSPAATSTVFVGTESTEFRVLLNSKVSCTLSMGDEGSNNTLLACYFKAE